MLYLVLNEKIRSSNGFFKKQIITVVKFLLKS
jgi:hypothetical protein